MLKETTPKICFVVMGFGVKTDYATGRQLDLNKSYKTLIKPVVESQGLECIRADEIYHSGSIDAEMYLRLLNSDIVIADLSTANMNAFYELGVRHALRPFSTIVISEDKLQYPFDLSHIRISKYTHLGDAIDFDEVIRFRTELEATINSILQKEVPTYDSPVYTCLQNLKPPFLKGLENSTELNDYDVSASAKGDLSAVIQQAENALEAKEFEKARELFIKASKMYSKLTK